MKRGSRPADWLDREGERMTEDEWLACIDPGEMVWFLRGRVSDRKFRLFACVRARQTRHLLRDKRSKTAIEVGERLADGAISERTRAAAWNAAQEVARGLRRGKQRRAAWFAAWSVFPIADEAALHAAWDFTDLMEFPFLCDLLRDIIGNPFRSVAVARSWFTPAVAGLSETVYQERAFDHLASLADALEEAGCRDADILAHCRGPGPHIRGCWPVDLILGRT